MGSGISRPAADTGEEQSVPGRDKRIALESESLGAGLQIVDSIAVLRVPAVALFHRNDSVGVRDRVDGSELLTWFEGTHEVGSQIGCGAAGKNSCSNRSVHPFAGRVHGVSGDGGAIEIEVGSEVGHQSSGRGIDKDHPSIAPARDDRGFVLLTALADDSADSRFPQRTSVVGIHPDECDGTDS
ncbi:hypothetical protein GCM10020255_051240 [Rhodococcus baikonurensis]